MDHPLSVGDQAVVTHNVCHLWQEQKRQENDRVSQLLVGAVVSLLELSPDGAWARIEGEDTYRGWCECRWLTRLPVTSPDTTVTVPFAELRETPEFSAPLALRLSIGSRLSVAGSDGSWASVVLPNGTAGWLPLDSITPLGPVAPEQTGAFAAMLAARFLGTPYLWGGSSAFGLDCSGLVQLCYRLSGVNLRRDADIQRTDARFFAIDQAELRPGDLVFFGTPDRITHVGMHFDDHRFIHSAGGAGVIITEWGDDRYSPGYVDARRLIPERALEPIQRHEDLSR